MKKQIPITSSQASGSIPGLGSKAADKMNDAFKRATDALEAAGFVMAHWTGDQKYQCCVCKPGDSEGTWGDEQTGNIKSPEFNVADGGAGLKLAEAIKSAQDSAKEACKGK